MRSLKSVGRRSLLAPLLVFVLGPLYAQNEIEDLRVETYYISDANDATDESGGTLAPGSRTYRVFLDLGPGCSLEAIFGDTNHLFSVTSTAPFFNNLDRGRTFGHQINSTALDENTVALDSWFALGAASNQKLGVEKSMDNDGSIVGGTNNDGGSGGIPGGLLVNSDMEAGIALTAQDGLIPLDGAIVPPPGFYTGGDDPSLVFQDSTLYNAFVSDSIIFGCAAPGVVGPTAENVVLLAQLTTAGELAFELNVLVKRPDGISVRFVANDSILLEGEQGFSLLTYPPQCGCTDPDYLEFDPGAGCDDGSCSTQIVFGCMDITACNFNPSANFSVPQLCCYGLNNCNGLDPYIVCPGVGIGPPEAMDAWTVHPNPANDRLTLHCPNGCGNVELTLIDALGRTIATPTLGQNASEIVLDMSILRTGIYSLRMTQNGRSISRTVVKN